MATLTELEAFSKRLLPFTGRLSQTEKYNIKFNSMIPISSKWFVVIHDQVHGIDDDSVLIVSEDHSTLLGVFNSDWYRDFLRDLEYERNQ